MTNVHKCGQNVDLNAEKALIFIIIKTYRFNGIL